MTNEFLDEQKRIVKTEEGEVRKQKKVQQDLLKKKEELAGQLEQGTREFQKLQISFEKRKSQQESILEQLKEQLSGAVFSWLAEDMEQEQGSGELVLFLRQGKKASDWLGQQKYRDRKSWQHF